MECSRETDAALGVSVSSCDWKIPSAPGYSPLIGLSTLPRCRLSLPCNNGDFERRSRDFGPCGRCCGGFYGPIPVHLYVQYWPSRALRAIYPPPIASSRQASPSLTRWCV